MLYFNLICLLVLKYIPVLIVLCCLFFKIETAYRSE